MSTARVPKLIAFDLEHNEPISFYKDVPEILHKIRGWKIDDALEGSDDDKVLIAACSRTEAPRLANQCLNLLLVPPSASQSRGLPAAAITFFDALEIYPGSKLTHFKRLNQKTGIDYEDMLFFDDEHRNKEVEKLGVTFIHVPSGLTRKTFEDGIEHWRKKSS